MSRDQVAALLWVAGVGAVIVLIVAGALALREDYSNGPDDPEPASAAETLDRVWDGMTTNQRLGMCAEVRAAGVQAAAAAFDAETSLEQDDVADWLRDRCGD